MRKIHLYVEGHKRLRPAVSDFIRRGIGDRPGLNVIACGATPVKDFCDGIALKPNDEHFLLMDADVLKSTPYRDTVKLRKDWKPPQSRAIPDEHLNFMVIMMETWFLADLDALRRFYGPDLQAAALPNTIEIEELTALDVKRALKKATRPLSRSKGVYDDDTKLNHSIAILKLLNPGKVAARAPHCKRLFDTLTQKLKELE